MALRVNEFEEENALKRPCMNSLHTGQIWVREVLDGHLARSLISFRMNKEIFVELLHEMQTKYGFKASRYKRGLSVGQYWLVNVAFGLNRVLAQSQYYNSPLGFVINTCISSVVTAGNNIYIPNPNLLIATSMKLHTHLIRPISSLKTSFFCYLHTKPTTLKKITPSMRRHVVFSTIKSSLTPKLGFSWFIWTTTKDSLRSRNVHNLIIDMLKEGTLFDSYWEALEQAKYSNSLIGPDAFLVLITAYDKLGLTEMALRSFGKMWDFDCKPDLLTYNAVLNVLMHEHVCMVDVTVYNQSVCMLTLAVYTQMMKSGVKANVVTCNILIDGLLKHDDFQSANNMYDLMTKNGISPDKFTYTSIISSLCRAKDLECALSLLDRMKQQGCLSDYVTYNTLINGFCKLGRMDEAFKHLRAFEENGFELGVDGYTCIIKGLFRERRYDDAYALYNRMIDLLYSTMIHLLYSTMIHLLVEARKFKKVMRLFDDMTKRGKIPDIYCYNPLIKGFCNMGLFNKAWFLQCEMAKRGCFPNDHTYTILICGM